MCHGNAPADLGLPRNFSVSTKIHLGPPESWEARSFPPKNCILVAEVVGLSVMATQKCSQKESSCLKGAGENFFGLLFSSKVTNSPAPRASRVAGSSAECYV